MADNVTLNAGTGGSVVAADELTDGTLGSVKVQYVKLMDGTLDGSTKAAVGARGLAVDIAAAAAAIAKAEDVASADADVGVPAMAVRKATPANTSGTDGDYEMLQMSAGRLWTSAVLEAGSAAIGKLAANTGVTIGAVEVAASQSIGVTGAAADAAAASGNPVTMAATGRTTNRTAVSDGQNVRIAADDLGRVVTVAGQVRDLIGMQHTQIASSSSETTIVTAIASTFNDLTMLVITNQTATAVNVTIKDSTGGTTRMIIALPASGGAVIPFPRPVPQATVNTNWTATLSSAAVTVNFFAQYEKNV